MCKSISRFIVSLNNLTCANPYEYAYYSYLLLSAHNLCIQYLYIFELNPSSILLTVILIDTFFILTKFTLSKCADSYETNSSATQKNNLARPLSEVSILLYNSAIYLVIRLASNISHIHIQIQLFSDCLYYISIYESEMDILTKSHSTHPHARLVIILVEHGYLYCAAV